jgi:peptidoglycan hydrolase CwlO-like protein
MTKKIGKLLIVLFIIGALVGAFLRTNEQEAVITDLNYELSTTRQELRNTKGQLESKDEELLDTREQLTKVADQLNQIRAYNEREYYMEEEINE